MSEAGFIAEARILVRPDTTQFRAELEAALATATKPITIPVVPVVASGIAGATAATDQFTVAQAGAAAETQAVAAALEKETIAATQATAAQSAHSRSVAGVARGAAASGLSLFGLRGATLAASGAFLAGTAAVVGFAKAVQSAADLQTELNVFKVTAGATADEMNRVSDAAKQLGRDITLPGVTAGDAAVAMTELAKAGLSVEDSMNGARGALQLATAAQIDNVTATKLVAGALNSFQLNGNEAVKVADLLTGAANASQGEISDMGTALGQASAVAHLFGVSLGDTVTLLTELAKAGLEGGRAGTSLRVAFLRLVNPPAAAAKALKELNVQIRDTQGNLRPQIFSDITKALEGYTKAQQQAKLATIFGSDAVRAAAIIGAQGADGFNTVSAAINQFGLAQQQAAARTSGLHGAVENLSNQVSALGLTIGKVSSGPIKTIINSLATYVQGANEAADATTGFITKLRDLAEEQALKVPGVKKDGFGLEDLKQKALELSPTLAGLSGNVADSRKKLDDFGKSAADVRAQILNIVSAGEQTGGDLGLNQTLVSLDLLVEKLNKGGPAAQKFASEVADVRTKLQEQGTKSFQLFPGNVEDLFPDDLKSGAAAAKVGKALRDSLTNSLPGAEIFSFTKASFDNVSAAIEVSGATAADTAKRVFANVLAAAQEQISKLGEQFDIAAAGGSTQGQLAALKRQQAEQQKIRDAADQAAKDIGAGNKGFATAVARRRAAQHELAGLNSQIKGIESQIASDAQTTATDAKASRDKANQAFLDALGGREGDLQNKVLAAQADKSLANDIATNKALRDFYVKSRAAAARTITDAKLRLTTVQAFTKDIITVNKTITDLVNQQIASQKEARQKQQAALDSSLNLDIDFAQTNKSVSGEIRARQALVKELEKEQSETKRGTVAWKQLRNDIAEQNAAIAALNKEKQKQNNAFASASFEFLQAQQGFASSLLGNLIPGSATAGLVGGGNGPVQAALQPASSFADGASKSGPTAGQSNTTNHYLALILQGIKELNGSASAPEARRQRTGQNAIFDYQAGF